MTLDYIVRPLKAIAWPDQMTPDYERVRSPFKGIWTATLDLLAREVRMLNGQNVVMHVDVDDRHIRADGALRADARPKSPAVLIAFERRNADTLVFPCDTYKFWQDNVKAIALAMENLRAVDRYGVRKGSQYSGFRQLAATSGSTLTAEQAAITLATLIGQPGMKHIYLRNWDMTRTAIRAARAMSHPDRPTGSHERWLQVEAIRKVLEAHHGEA